MTLASSPQKKAINRHFWNQDAIRTPLQSLEAIFDVKAISQGIRVAWCWGGIEEVDTGKLIRFMSHAASAAKYVTSTYVT
jgi:hypothetical protein